MYKRSSIHSLRIIILYCRLFDKIFKLLHTNMTTCRCCLRNCSVIPTAVVRGLQLGVGLNLATKGVSLVWFKDAEAGLIRELSGSESLFLGLFGAAFILATVFPYEKLEMPRPLAGKKPADSLETTAETEAVDGGEEAPAVRQVHSHRRLHKPSLAIVNSATTSALGKANHNALPTKKEISN